MTKTAYRAARLYDGLGSPPLTQATVLVEDGIIADVGTHIALGADWRQVDLGDVTVLPGLVDAHVHLVWGAEAVPHLPVELDGPRRTLLRMARRAAQTLDHGVTTVRDLGSTDSLAIDLAEAIEAGDVPGPRVIAAGRAIAITGGHAWQITAEADGADQIRAAVRSEIKRGASVIKLMASGGVYDTRAGLNQPQLTGIEMAAAVEAAHNAGLKVAAHAYTPGPIRSAVTAGVDSIEHGSFLDKPTADLMATRGTYFVPTAMAAELIVRNAETIGTPPHMREKALKVRDAVRQAIATALHTGVPIAAGTDAGGAGIMHGTLHEEAAILAECGATVADVVRICTSAGAELCGLSDQIGAIRPGMRADLLALRGDLGTDVRRLRDVALVLKDGRPRTE